MNKWIFCLLPILPVMIWATPLDSQEELKAIEKEIQILKDRLHHNRMEEMKGEIEGQGLMISDWSAYAKDLEHIHQLEKKDEEIQQRIRELEERKDHLFQQKLFK